MTEEGAGEKAPETKRNFNLPAESALNFPLSQSLKVSTVVTR